MNVQILKPILGGLIIGAALFFAPFFVLKVLAVLLLIGLLFRFFGRRHYRGPGGWAYADKIRTMSDEEYLEFKSRWGRRCGRHPGEEVQPENQ